MLIKALKRILARVPKWPQAAQSELLRVAREIEEGLVIGPHLHDELDEARDQAMLGTGTSLDDLQERRD